MPAPRADHPAPFAAQPLKPCALKRDGSEYPDGLADLPDAPAVVYAIGRIPPRRVCVAIVGARAATPYGLRVAAMLARDLAAVGIAVVSGLARGIDAAAHRGALEAGGKTVAVLPAGLDHVTPPHHRALASEIAQRGALFSEYATGSPWGPGAFVRRNRLIAAQSSAVVVVEAGETSGALSTARRAVRLGRPVLAVPGDIDRPASQGCFALLREGARLCASAADVLQVLDHAPANAELRVLELLGETPCALEALAARAALPIPEALAILLRLTWAGAVAQLPGQRWRRAGAA